MADPRPRNQGKAAISIGRQLAGVLLAAVSLPLLTYLLTLFRPHLNLADDVLAYLVAVVTITVLGGFWPAVLAAVAASLLLNWYFTEPLSHLHHRAAQRTAGPAAVRDRRGRGQQRRPPGGLGARSRPRRPGKRPASLLELAQTVLAGADSPAAVLEHLTTDPRRPGRAAGAGGRAVDPGRVQRHRGQPADGLPASISAPT